MKRILIFTLLFAIVQTICGRTFVIKRLNTPTITINGKANKVGDSFDDKAKISWASTSQAMKVLSDDNKIYVFSPKLFEKYHSKSWKDYLTSVEALGVRNDGENFPVSEEDHRALFEGNHLLFDSLSFKVGWAVDDNSYFVASTNDFDNKISFKIPAAGDEIVLTRELLAPILENENVDELSLTIKYVETEYDMSTLLTEAMNLIIVPETLTDF